MPEICPICEGSTMRIVRRPDGVQFAEPCTCRILLREARLLTQSQIPKRYEHCTLRNFEIKFQSANKSLESARFVAKSFVESFPAVTAGNGLLITGPIGVGKTHLAVGILRELNIKTGISGLFYDYRELLKAVQNSWNRQVSITELEVLAPVFETEVLVLDELGAAKPTDWVWDTVAHILNTRYNDRRTTIITTNYANLPPLGSESQDGDHRDQSPSSQSFKSKRPQEETLGDRIGERMRSRLQEMCAVVQMQGKDFRQQIKRASFV